ncbi:MAG: restriction endonuclease subunit S, partial [Anaerolineae bacterium]|nr:restriction endonuclease subunit S [Anaerolineae bacterium]
PGKKYQEAVGVGDTAVLPDLPDGWVWARVEQTASVQLGRQRAPKHHNGPYMRPYLRVANVFEDRIDTTDVLKMNFSPQEYETYRLEYGDILLNEGQSLELVGRPAIYRNEVPGACFQNTLVRYRAYEGILNKFSLIVFLAYLNTGRFQKIAKWTTNIAHLGASRFAELEFPLPPLAEQKRIVAEVERRLSVVAATEQAIATNLARAERLRQSILHRAFTGQLVT